MFKEVSEDLRSVTIEIKNAWNETSLLNILSRYKLKDIYNADEFGLFYQRLPKKTLQMKGEKCSGGKHSKVQLFGMAAASAARKLPIFVISKSAKPRCFKNVKSLPFRYRSQVKSWMNSFFFDEWLNELDKMFEKENRNVILVVDNCPAHPIIEGLKAVELVFLPPNTTSKTQPMDQGVIRSLKAKYHNKSYSKAAQSSGNEKGFPRHQL